MNVSAKVESSIEVTGNAAWQVRKNAAIARGEGNAAPIYVDRARGSEIWDVEGRRYVDFGAGIAVCNTGHMHPKIHAAVTAQLERFSHTCVMVTPYDSAVMLAERLNKCAPGDSLKKSMFVTTGAEAVENAIKIARAHTDRRGVIAFDGGYHGRTMMTLGLTGKVTPYKNRFGPFPGEIYRAPFPIAYHGISVEDSLRALQILFKTDIEPRDCAAIIVEPVQGEGGFYPAPDAFLQALRQICDEHGILLIFDEIQTGFGRTGKLFAAEHAEVEADLMTVAKGLAGGFPLAAVIGKQEIMDAPEPGGLGGTYAGSPIGCAAALAVLDVIEEESLVEASVHIGRVFAKRLLALQAEFPDRIGDVRCDRGAMVALELVENGDANCGDAALTKAIVTAAYQKGLIALTCGVRGNVFRFLPALTISDELIHEGLDIFEQCFRDALADKR
ncbi:4-aminobutyrate--2-oxoglutarate transaminase [Parasphingorhabdus sp.]|uniref:4-aminobutyrate--2-oxoglutarate transaminase n=1 Tax=Parasphingorhabdus sp. TaxID=2709688 RepID=UPI002B2735A6|nr:4-aminobutyrate--2-oxoglutarate transaminase [Parasphingorhabdus sp.]|tara:strand:+ start:758 stop:2089 length:1332 start_codon:yes stop_codon:yes gene_type:complete